MAVTDTWGGWSTAAASNSPAGGATPEIDDELRNIKAQVKANAMALSGAQTVADVKTFSSYPLFTNTAAPSATNEAVHKAYVDSAITGATTDYESTANKGAANGYCGLDASTLVAAANLGTGASTNTYLRGDQSYQYPDNPLIILRHKEASGTNGGGLIGGSWVTRTLNEELIDTDNLCSLSSNQFTLEAGEYEIEVDAPFCFTNASQIRLYNVSDTAVQADIGANDIYGTTVYPINTGTVYAPMLSQIKSRFLIASSKTLEIQARSVTTNTVNGYGISSAFGGPEVYMLVRLKMVG